MCTNDVRTIESWLVRLPDGSSFRVDRTRQEPVELFKTGPRIWMSNGKTRVVSRGK